MYPIVYELCFDDLFNTLHLLLLGSCLDLTLFTLLNTRWVAGARLFAPPLYLQFVFCKAGQFSLLIDG